MKTIGVLYSTVDGQTKKICEFMASRLEEKNFKVQLFPIENFDGSISEYDTFVIGGSIRYGKHNELIPKFIEENRETLEKVKTAFFSVNLVARKADKDLPETNPYLIKFMESIAWRPDLLDVFAGSLDYSKYGFWDSLMIKMIMIFTHGPTKTPEPIEYTSWERVKAFADNISNLNTG